MVKALEGKLVVAIEQAVAAPVCTSRLADGGARVIKIERAEGETARHYDGAVFGTSAYFAWLNRGKQSIVLDIKSAGDRALVQRMIARADIFVQNLAPGAAARLDLDARSLCREFPGLVAVDICGYGQDTPARDMRAYDMLVQAESGICSVTGSADEKAKVGVSIADIATGMNAHAAVLEALISRERDGRGRAIEIAMFDSMADWMAVPLLHKSHGGRETGRWGLSHASIYPYGAFACADGEIMIAIQAPAEWRRFCRTVLERPELADDARFADNVLRVTNRAELGHIIAGAFAGRRRADLIGLLDAGRIAWGRVSSIDDVLRHPALRHVPAHVAGGDFQLPRPAGRDEQVPSEVPELDQHGIAIREEFGA
ncbi:CaiB/BaiF CoA transferase family protein [Sphingosinicella rhizophila]|uniref:CoA transferase n=1 Tax=Sphingosinicella rhizophila TaxID=3050082 RepID=A0ABU3Q5T9_9SPHN|nr:CoA transferase [Sphingosinicella sp. GR2756]MDT9598778.1 CoA transferase [Sphingosinicella sp. GR2756]